MEIPKNIDFRIGLARIGLAFAVIAGSGLSSDVASNAGQKLNTGCNPNLTTNLFGIDSASIKIDPVCSPVGGTGPIGLTPLPHQDFVPGEVIPLSPHVTDIFRHQTS